MTLLFVSDMLSCTITLKKYLWKGLDMEENDNIARFGLLLKKLRLDAGFGLRTFAEMIEMPASNLSAIEHGRRSMPDDKIVLAAQVIGLEKGSDTWSQFFDLAKVAGEIAADVKPIASKGFVPALLRTIDNVQLTDDDIQNLIHEIRGRDVGTQAKSN
jgi:transcriptional regulator with XRE-family HTH domain